MKINKNHFLTDKGYSNYENSLLLPRHRWYYYKEGFSPYLIENAIQEVGLSKNDLIIDPFNGGGTTTLTASISGYQSLGIEVNPFTAFLSNTKISDVNVSDLDYWKNKLIKSIDTGFQSPLLNFSTFSKNNGIKKWLFSDDILNSFEGGWQATNQISSDEIRNIFRIALISTAMQNCNAKRDGKCFRYYNSWTQKIFNKDAFIESFKNNLINIETDIQESFILEKAKIINGDSREILSSYDFKPFKLCITSPPYLNTFDYTDIYRPELFLGKFVNNAQELYDLRLKTVRSHIQAKWKKPSLNNFGILYQKTMEHINQNLENLMHKNIPLMIQAYFEDMLNILKLLKKRASKNAQIWFVVSNSAYAGYEVPVDLIIGDIAGQAGWFLKEIGVLRYLKKRKTKYSENITQLRESVVILVNNRF